jgi:hypothetical protein
MKPRRRFVHTLILIVAVVGALGGSASRAANADLVELHLYAPSIDASVWFARGDGARWPSPCPNSGQPSHGRCLVRVERGTTVILTAQDGAISKFQRWEQPCNGTDTTCTVQVNDDVVNVTGRFSPLRLWYPKFGRGSISVESRSGDPGRGCGLECRDFANGEIVTVRARPSAGYKFTGWGGDCARVRSRGCYFPMTKNRMVGATFEKIPPPDNCPPNQSCDPVKVAQSFRIVINGRGTVMVGKIDAWGPDFCRISCTLERTRRATVEIKAQSERAGGSQVWGGRCRGSSSTCRFPNKKDLGGDPIISVAFR